MIDANQPMLKTFQQCDITKTNECREYEYLIKLQSHRSFLIWHHTDKKKTTEESIYILSWSKSGRGSETRIAD